MVYLIICLLIGCGLGLRFKVLVLIPIVALAVALAIAGRIAGGGVFWSVLTAVAAAASLQIGYLIGLGIRLIADARADRSRSLSSTSPTRQTVR